MTGLARQALPQSLLGKACSYLLNHWEVLVAHQNHSFTRIDNNLVENAIRPSAIGKKNWLFIGHPAAGQRSAILNSLVVSCQRHGQDPLAYLSDVLAKLPALTKRVDLTPLTPAAWQPSSVSRFGSPVRQSSHGYAAVRVVTLTVRSGSRTVRGHSGGRVLSFWPVWVSFSEPRLSSAMAQFAGVRSRTPGSWPARNRHRKTANATFRSTV